MLDISNFKRRLNSNSKLVYSRRSSSCNPRNLTSENYQLIGDDIEVIDKLPLKPMFELHSNNNQLQEKINFVSNVLQKKEDFAVKSNYPSTNTRFEEIQNKILEIRRMKQQLSQELQELSRKSEIKQLEIKEESEQLISSISSLKRKKEKIIENSNTSKSSCKFFRDLTNLEILEINSNPKTITMEARHENKFIQFQLIENEDSFDYRLLNTSINIELFPESFCNDMFFEKDQFPKFYVGFMEFLYSLE